jgi:predicted enzyme related to lactoylglutathione lyase
MARVTGIGGIFFRARDPKALAAWYGQHLGIQLSDWGGAKFLWADEVPPSTGSTAWSPFPADTTYFGSGAQQYMVNYRVDDLDALIAQLEAAGVPVDPQRENASYGRFAWITDPEGNRIELWQPIAEEPPGPAV